MSNISYEKEKLKEYLGDQDISDNFWNNEVFMKQIMQFISRKTGKGEDASDRNIVKIEETTNAYDGLKTAYISSEDNGNTVIIYGLIDSQQLVTVKMHLMENGKLSIEHYRMTTYHKGPSPHGGTSNQFNIWATKCIYDENNELESKQKYKDTITRNDVHKEFEKEFPLQMLKYEDFSWSRKGQHIYQYIPIFSKCEGSPTLWCSKDIKPASNSNEPHIEIYRRISPDFATRESVTLHFPYEHHYYTGKKEIVSLIDGSLIATQEWPKAWNIHTEDHPEYKGMNVEQIISGKNQMTLGALHTAVQRIASLLRGKRK